MVGRVRRAGPRLRLRLASSVACSAFVRLCSPLRQASRSRFLPGSQRRLAVRCRLHPLRVLAL
eukprot:61672-Pleurochrysis_carterae.AAC.1